MLAAARSAVGKLTNSNGERARRSSAFSTPTAAMQLISMSGPATTTCVRVVDDVCSVDSSRDSPEHGPTLRPPMTLSAARGPRPTLSPLCFPRRARRLFGGSLVAGSHSLVPVVPSLPWLDAFAFLVVARTIASEPGPLNLCHARSSAASASAFAFASTSAAFALASCCAAALAAFARSTCTSMRFSTAASASASACR